MTIEINATMNSLWNGGWTFLMNYYLYIIIFAVLVFAVYKRRYNKFYQYKVRAYKRRENGRRLEVNYPAGYGKDKAGISFFRVKLSRKPGDHRDMYELPDAQYMDEENRVHYEIVNPNVWIQVKRTYVPNQVKLQEIEFIKDYGTYKKGFKAYLKEDFVDFLTKDQTVQLTGKEQTIDASDVVYKPITSAEKKLVVQELWDAKQVLGADTWKTYLPWVGGAVLILGAGLLVYLLNTGALK